MQKFTKHYPKIAKGIRYTGNALAIAKQAYDMAKVVAAVVNSEKKYHDYAATTNPDTAAQLVQLTAIPQGDGTEERTGDSIAIRSLQLEAQIQFHESNPKEVIRVMIVRDNDNANNTAPSINQILESASTIAFRNKDYPKRFKTLYDKVFTCDASKLVRTISYYKKFKMMKDHKGNPTVARHVTWSNDGNDIARGHLWMVVIGSVATASTTSEIRHNSRIRYMDN